MLNSYDNPECLKCEHVRWVGCGTKIVDGKRKHISVLNCTAKDSCSPNKDNCVKRGENNEFRT